MKTLTYMLALLIVLASCQNPIETTDSDLTVKSTVSNDPLVLKLRQMTFKDFETIEIDKSEFDQSIFGNTQTVGSIPEHEMLNTPYFTDLQWWVRVPNPQTPPYYYGDSSVPWTNQGADLETYMYLPNGLVAIGLGGRSTNDNFSNSGIYGRYLLSDYNLGTLSGWYKHNTSNLEVYYTWGTSQDRVVVGVGHRVTSGDVKGIWIYTAPYDAIAKEISIQSPGDITIYVYKSGPEANLIPEVEIRSWDVYTDMVRVRKTFVTGYGGGTHHSNATRAGLRFEKLN